MQRNILYAAAILTTGVLLGRYAFNVKSPGLESKYHGTNIGYDACLQANGTHQSNIDSLIAKMCADRHAIVIDEPVWPTSLSGSYEYSNWNNKYNFNIGPLFNVPDNPYAITSIEIWFEHVDNRDSQGNIVREYASTSSGILFMPGGGGFKTNIVELKFQPAQDRMINDASGTPLYRWGISKVKGVLVQIKSEN